MSFAKNGSVQPIILEISIVTTKVEATKLDGLRAETKKAETKVKGLTTMVESLENQKDNIEAQIAALEDECYQRYRQKKEELKEQLSALDTKLLDKQQKLMTAEQQLRDLNGRLQQLNDQKKSLEKGIQTMAGDAIRRHDNLNAKMKETEEIIKEKRAEIAKIDKTGELTRAHKHIEDREAVLYRHWPEARNAVNAIFRLGSSPTANDFTPQQALDVEHAIVTSGTNRTDAAQELLSLAQKDFDNNRTWRRWADNAGREVMKIATNTHHRLTALLSQQSKDTPGGPSYITDLTDWAGNQIQL